MLERGLYRWLFYTALSNTITQLMEYDDSRRAGSRVDKLTVCKQTHKGTTMKYNMLLMYRIKTT